MPKLHNVPNNTRYLQTLFSEILTNIERITNEHIPSTKGKTISVSERTRTFGSHALAFDMTVHHFDNGSCPS
jgi:hypothetical protein